MWNTPNSGYAERFKHTIEPTFGIQRTTAIDQSNLIIVNDGIDQTIGNTTSINYGISNRLYAKRHIGTTSQAQQIVVVDLFQTYYSDARASTVDPRYSTTNIPGLTTTPPSNFSPITMNVRVSPTISTDTAVHVELDSRYKTTQTRFADERVQLGVAHSDVGDLEQEVLHPSNWEASTTRRSSITR